MNIAGNGRCGRNIHISLWAAHLFVLFRVSTIHRKWWSRASIDVKQWLLARL